MALDENSRLDVTFRNIRASDAMREKAEKKFEKAAKHLRGPVEAHLVFHVEKHRHCAELTVTSAGELLKVQEETDDMYATIDGVMGKLERAARRRREKKLDRDHHGAEELDGFTNPDPDPDDDVVVRA